MSTIKIHYLFINEALTLYIISELSCTVFSNLAQAPAHTFAYIILHEHSALFCQSCGNI